MQNVGRQAPHYSSRNGTSEHKKYRICTFVLLPAVIDAVKVPVIASGGVCDGKTLAAALCMGAVGAQMGTRFIATTDCEFHMNYKKAVVDCQEYGDTVCPGAYSDLRLLKGQGASESLEMHKSGKFTHEQIIEMVDKKLIIAERDGNVVTGEVAAGQCSSRISDLPSAKELIERIVNEAIQAILKTNSLLVS